MDKSQEVLEMAFIQTIFSYNILEQQFKVRKATDSEWGSTDGITLQFQHFR